MMKRSCFCALIPSALLFASGCAGRRTEELPALTALTPDAAASRRISSASASDMAMGFYTITWTPRRTAAQAQAACRPLGRAMLTSAGRSFSSRSL